MNENDSNVIRDERKDLRILLKDTCPILDVV